MKKGYRRQTKFEKKNIRSRLGSPESTGSWVDRRVDGVLPSYCTGWFFNNPEPVQPPGPRSTCQAGFNNNGHYSWFSFFCNQVLRNNIYKDFCKLIGVSADCR